MSKERSPRIFGGKDDASFWAGKPMQKGHPEYRPTPLKERVSFGKHYYKRCFRTGKTKRVVECRSAENLRDFRAKNYFAKESEA